MRLTLFIVFLFFNCRTGMAQDFDEVLQDYDTTKSTIAKLNVFYNHYSSSADSIPVMINKVNKALSYFEKKSDLTGIAIANSVISNKYIAIGDYTNSIRYGIAALKNFEASKDNYGTMQTLFLVGNSLIFSKNFEQALPYLTKALTLAKVYNDIFYADILNAIAYNLVKLNKVDSSFQYVKQAISIGWEKKDTFSLAYYISTYGEAYLANKNYDLAKPLINQSFKYSVQNDIGDLLVVNSNDLAELFYNTAIYDSSIFYANRSVEFSKRQPAYRLVAYEWLYKSFEKKEKNDSVSKYFRLAVNLRDSIYSEEKSKTVQALNFLQQSWEKEKEQELILAKKDFNHRLILYSALGILMTIIIITILLYRNNQHQKKAKAEVESAYRELKSTQTQLIQSEKMASLGELTAGIAHEIQNPLNFVNNFSDVNKELLSELKDEIQKGNVEEANAIADDVINNSEKINHHGKRADAIVKGMLQHSRKSEGSKEPTDINKLCDEYLRLSYHGLRTKDKNFNATLQTDFDESIGKINIIPQDIGRVLLNLFNNAFYAVNEKQKQAPTGYDAKVSITTKAVKSPLGELGVYITVSDNGNGIPSNIIDKIFQPFFTTKPTGNGTGLGLSLAYDIVKAHGGDLKVESEEGERTTFIVQLNF